jgi:hypothetical protein
LIFNFNLDININILPPVIDPKAELSELQDGPFSWEMRGYFCAYNKRKKYILSPLLLHFFLLQNLISFNKKLDFGMTGKILKRSEGGGEEEEGEEYL